jgi:hypothetical protein
MLAELYIEALLANETRADRVWQAWNAGDIDDETAAISWTRIAETLVRPALCETPAMLYSDSETAWLNLRAEKIAAERGWPLPIARSEAAAEMVRMRTREPAPVLQFRLRFSPIRGLLQHR